MTHCIVLRQTVILFWQFFITNLLYMTFEICDFINKYMLIMLKTYELSRYSRILV